MTEFGSRGFSLLSEPANWLGRFAMGTAAGLGACHVWGFPMNLFMMLFVSAFDGWLRWWVAPTSRSFVVRPAGVEVWSLLRVRVVPWESLSAIQTWHYPRYTDFVAIHYRRAGRLSVATCSAHSPEEELRQFVGACASYVPQPLTIAIAGITERSVWSRLLRRLVTDIAIASLVGAAVGAARIGFYLGLAGALISAVVAAVRSPLRTKTFVQHDGLWECQKPRARPLRVIPRSLRHWVRGLDEAAYRAETRA